MSGRLQSVALLAQPNDLPTKQAVASEDNQTVEVISRLDVDLESAPTAIVGFDGGVGRA